LGKSSYFFGLIATLTTGETENFIHLKGIGFSAVVIVAFFLMILSSPAKAQVFPHGIS
jgi:hypothetical protein